MNTVQEAIDNAISAAKEKIVTEINTALVKFVEDIVPQVSKPETKSISFAGMGIADAAVAYLRTVKEKKGTQEILEVLTAAGVKTQKGKTPDYNTIYTLLRRREEKTGDIKSIKGKWNLVEKVHTLAA